jgi:lysozyme
VADYVVKYGPAVTRDWLFWQYSDAANINGISTPADMNVFKGDTAAFCNILLK